MGRNRGLPAGSGGNEHHVSLPRKAGYLHNNELYKGKVFVLRFTPDPGGMNWECRGASVIMAMCVYLDSA